MNFHPPATNVRLRRRDAAAYIKERVGFGSASFLAKQAITGGGPKFQKFGSRVVLYTIPELDSWIESKLTNPVGSTSETEK